MSSILRNYCEKNGREKEEMRDMAAERESMLIMKNVSKTFNPGTVNEKRAITDLSLHLETGEFVTVIGSNGAGKSTLFNAIAGSFYVDDGAITVGGHDMTFLPEYKRAKRIGRLFQDPLKGTAPNMTIEENLALAAGNGGWFSRLTQKDRARFRDRLALLDMGLEDRLNQPVGLLSGGQRQALTLLMATLVTPKLLLLDEHTAALDPKTAAKVLQATDRIIERDHLTTLMITHNMRDAIVHGNRLIMMHEGRVILDIRGEEKKRLTVEDLMHEFEKASGEIFASDKALLG